MAREVRRNDGDRRYELLVDGELVGVADYVLHDDAVVMPHTEIVPQRRGRGYGDVLVQGALDDIRAAGRSVVPVCWFVAQYIDLHDEYADLVA